MEGMRMHWHSAYFNVGHWSTGHNMSRVTTTVHTAATMIYYDPFLVHSYDKKIEIQGWPIQQMVRSRKFWEVKLPGLHPFGKLVVRGVLRTPRLVAVALRASPCDGQGCPNWVR